MTDFLTYSTHSLTSLNDMTAGHGLTLTLEQTQALITRETDALQTTGRIVLGTGILPALIQAFYDSPYVEQRSYEEVLGELAELFYVLKNETEPLLADDELLTAMRLLFDGPAGGDLTALSDMTPRTFILTGLKGAL